MTEKEKNEHEMEMAKIEARKAAWAKSPFWFIAWSVLMVGLLAQCTCGGCIW